MLMPIAQISITSIDSTRVATPNPATTTTPWLASRRVTMLIENGIYLLESIFLEEIAREQVYEFLFVMLPLKIRGATGSMVDPLAMV